MRGVESLDGTPATKAPKGEHDLTALVPLNPPVVAPPVTPREQASFDAALKAFVTHDRAGDWTPETCGAVASEFESLAHQLPVASYDAGLTWQRYHDDLHARAEFEDAAKGDPNLVQARVQVSLYRFKADGNLDASCLGGTWAGRITDAVVVADVTRDSKVLQSD